MSRRAAAVLAAAVLALGACSDDPTGPVFQVIEEVTFDPSLGITLADYTELPSGVYTLDLTVGTGDVIASGDVVSLDYTGWLTDGAVFDARTADFNYLVDRLIPGFEIGLEGMAVGGVRRMIIPPEQAYGGQAVGVVPAGSVLIFEVELVSLN